MAIGIPPALILASLGSIGMIVFIVLELRKRKLTVSDDATIFENHGDIVKIFYGGEGGIPYVLNPKKLIKHGLHAQTFDIEGVNEYNDKSIRLRGCKVKNFRINSEDIKGFIGIVHWYCNIDADSEVHNWAVTDVVRERMRMSPEELELFKERVKEGIKKEKEFFEKTATVSSSSTDGFSDYYKDKGDRF